MNFDEVFLFLRFFSENFDFMEPVQHPHSIPQSLTTYQYSDIGLYFTPEMSSLSLEEVINKLVVLRK